MRCGYVGETNWGKELGARGGNHFVSFSAESYALIEDAAGCAQGTSYVNTQNPRLQPMIPSYGGVRTCLTYSYEMPESWMALAALGFTEILQYREKG